MAKTNFPTQGDDQKISLSNSKHPQFSYSYAKDLRENHPEIWRKGGNIRGNSAFTNWGKARSGSDSKAVLDWIKEREAWAARHKDNKNIAGVVAQVKWGVIGSRGVSYMKKVINDAKKKKTKGDGMDIEHKRVGRTFDEVIDEQKDEEYEEYKGIQCKVIKGYLATWDRDRGNDKFHAGCFKDSLKQWRKEGRDIKVKEMHGKTIGVYPLKYVKEDEVGLYGHAYINMEITQGREAYSKAKMGIYDRKSIGFRPDPDTTKGEFPFGRDIYKAHVYEGSLVDEPMNIAAKITDVKTAWVEDIPIADPATPFDRKQALANVIDWAREEDEPHVEYNKAFILGKLQIADVIDDELTLIPKAIYKAAAMLKTGKGLDGFTDEDIIEAKASIDQLYESLDKHSPWGTKMLNELLGNEEEIKALSVRDIEQAFKDAGLSDTQAKCLISTIKGNEPEPQNESETELDILGQLLDDILT